MHRFSQASPHIAEFAAHNRTQSRLAKKTVEAYEREATAFAEFLSPRRIEHATSRDVLIYIDNQLKQGLKASSTQRKLFAIRAFFQFLRRHKVRDDDPTEGLTIPDESDRQEQAVLTRGDVRKVIDAAQGRFEIRDRALISLYASGLKRTEVTAINLADVDLEKEQCKVGKRVIPLTRELRDVLAAYIAARPKTKCRALFVSMRDDRLTWRQAWTVVRQAADRADIDKRVTPQILRDTYAVHQIEDGRSLIDLARIMGVNMGRLENYTFLARKDHNRADPFMLSEISDDVFERVDMRHIKQLWRKIVERLPGDPDGAITAARSLLEAICKKILSTCGVESLVEADNLSALSKKALMTVLPRNMDGDEDHVLKFTRTAAGLVDQVALYRNKVGDAHGSAERRIIYGYQIEYAVALAMTTAAFLVHCYDVYLRQQTAKEAQSLDSTTVSKS